MQRFRLVRVENPKKNNPVGAVLKKLPPINAEKLRFGIVCNMARPQLEKIFDNLGPKRLAYMVENNVHLSEYVTPDIEDKLKEKATQYSWANSVVSDKDIFNLIPRWAQNIITDNADKGVSWWAKEVAWMRSFFLGG